MSLLEGQAVRSVSELHRSGSDLYTTCVAGSDDASVNSILNELDKAITCLNENWRTRAGGERIAEVVLVYNALVGIGNALSELAVASTDLASKYRHVELINGASGDELSKISYESKTGKNANEYAFTEDSVTILPGANDGKIAIDKANAAIDTFVNKVRTKIGEIEDNWTQGSGRDEAVQAFQSFVNTVGQYKEKLANVSQNITTALENYNSLQ